MKLLDNEDFYSQLIHRRAEKNLCKTSLIISPDGCGRGYAARILAAYYLCYDENDIPSFAESPGSEVITVEGEGASGEIKISAIRDLIGNAYETSLDGRGRVVIIKEANRLNRSSANALLKILEEPPEGLLFILTASSVGDLPSTIVSRCTKYYISPVTLNTTKKYVDNTKLNAREKQLCVAAFNGRLGAIKRFADSKKYRNLLIRAGDVVDAALVLDEYKLLMSLSGKGREERRDLEQLFYCTVRLFLAAATGNYSEGLQPQMACYFAASAVSTGAAQLKRNLNQKLIIIGICEGIKEAFND